MDLRQMPNIEDLSEPERAPADQRKIEEINQLILNKGRKGTAKRQLGVFSRRNKRSNSHCSNKTTASTVTVISKHSIPPELLKSKDLAATASELEDSKVGSTPAAKRDDRPHSKAQLESVLEVG